MGESLKIQQQVLLCHYMLVFNGVSSKFKSDDNITITGNSGASNMSGFVLGLNPDVIFSNIQVKEIICRNVADTAQDEQEIYAYLQDKYFPVLDGNTVAWFDSQDLRNITKDGSNLVSVWKDRSGNAHDLEQATGTNQPLWSADGITFDGVDNFMKTAAFTYNQPEMVYLVLKQLSNSSKFIFDGNASNSAELMYISSTGLLLYAGTVLGYAVMNITDYHIVRVLFSGVDSKIQVDENEAIIGNGGTGNPGGITLGSIGAGTSDYNNMTIKEVIFRNVADNSSDETKILNYLAVKYSITL
jgi:hypothetical protein